MKPKKYYPPLLPGRFFHVFNRGNNGDNLFYQERNYAYFLRKYFEYMSPVLDTYCYCLLPNHFHLLVRVKEEAVVFGDKKGFHPWRGRWYPWPIVNIDSMPPEKKPEGFPIAYPVPEPAPLFHKQRSA